jgi:branched-chain amino acid transport system substrate-binding protein
MCVSVLPILIFLVLKLRRFKMSIKRFTQSAFVLAIVALIVGLSACDQIQQVLLPAQPETPPEMEDVGVEIPIGVVLAQTGEFAPAYGLPMLGGFELAREHINNSGMLGGAKLKLIIKDDQSVSAVEAFNKLINQDGVSAITGLAISTQLEQVIPIAQENGVVVLSSVSSAPDLSARGEFIFRVGLNSGVLNPAAVKATHEKSGYQTAATIYHLGDTYATRSDEAFRAALVESDVAVVTTETYQDGDTDYSAQLTRIMELNPDVLFISALGSHIPEIMIQARQLMPSVAFVVPELTNIEVAAAGDAAEGATTAIGWLSTTDVPMNQAFVQSYTAKHGMEPVAWAAQSYATLNILAAAIVQAYAATHSIDATAIRDALAHTMDAPTVLGNFSFGADGDAVYAPNILAVENGEFVAFE